MDIKSAKKTPLGVFPTPLQFLPRLTEHLNLGDIFIKRDDMTDVGLSGNKIRKLEYIIHDAKQKGCTALMTFGGTQSNHARLTAAAAAKCGMKCILMLSGKRPDYASGNLALDAMLGADIYFLGGEFMEGGADEQALIDSVVARYAQKGEKVYSVPIGGGNEIGALGYINMVPELMEQMRAQGINAKHLVCGAGSIGTFAGLWIGAKYYGAPFGITGISICAPVVFNMDFAVDYINRTCKYFGLDLSCTPDDLNIVYDTYVLNGYNVPDAITREYMRLMAQKEAIILDPTYTGKVFFGLVDTLRRGVIPQNEGVILLHSGGTPAVWTKEHLDASQPELWGEGAGKKLY